MKIEMNYENGIPKARHFVDQTPGPKDKSLKLEPLRFVVGSQENKKHSAILH